MDMTSSFLELTPSCRLLLLDVLGQYFRNSEPFRPFLSFFNFLVAVGCWSFYVRWPGRVSLWLHPVVSQHLNYIQLSIFHIYYFIYYYYIYYYYIDYLFILFISFIFLLYYYYFIIIIIFLLLFIYFIIIIFILTLEQVHYLILSPAGLERPVTGTFQILWNENARWLWMWNLGNNGGPSAQFISLFTFIRRRNDSSRPRPWKRNSQRVNKRPKCQRGRSENCRWISKVTDAAAAVSASNSPRYRLLWPL